MLVRIQIHRISYTAGGNMYGLMRPLWKNSLKFHIPYDKNFHSQVYIQIGIQGHWEDMYKNSHSTVHNRKSLEIT